MADKILLLHDAGTAVRRLRKAKGIRASHLAQLTGKSRDTLHRLERGDDVSLSTLLAVLAGLGCALEIIESGPLTLREMERRFADDVNEDE